MLHVVSNSALGSWHLLLGNSTRKRERMGNDTALEKCQIDGRAGVTIETTGHLTSWSQFWSWSRSFTYYPQLHPSSCCSAVNGYPCIFQLRNIFWHWGCQAWNKPHLYYHSFTLQNKVATSKLQLHSVPNPGWVPAPAQELLRSVLVGPRGC